MEANQNKYLWALLAAAVVVGGVYYFSDKPKGVSGADEKIEGFDKISLKKRKSKRRAGAFARMEKAGTLLKKNRKGKRK